MKKGISFGSKTNSHMFNVYTPRIIVLMLNPRVGLIPEISSPFNFLSIVVLPALSSPLHSAVPPSIRGGSENTIEGGGMISMKGEEQLDTCKNRILISFVFALFFRMIVNKPLQISATVQGIDQWTSLTHFSGQIPPFLCEFALLERCERTI